MKFTFIDIRDIFRQQHEIMKAESSNRILFYIVPVVLGALFSIIFYKVSEKVLNILTLFLSIAALILETAITEIANKITTTANNSTNVNPFLFNFIISLLHFQY